MEMTSLSRDAELTLRFSGELDHHAAKAAMRVMDKELEEQLPRALVLDLGGLQFMDSSGIAVVMRAYRRMQELGGSVCMKNVPDQPGKVLRTAAMDRLVPIETKKAPSGL